MPGINAQACADSFDATGAAIADVWGSTGGWFEVLDNPVLVRLQYGAKDAPQYSGEQLLGTGAFGTIPDSCRGIAFRNADAGQVARVTAYIGTNGDLPATDPDATLAYPEPVLSISAIGTVSVPGNKTPTQTVFAAPGNNSYSPPSGATSILVECIGGGGAGGGTAATGAATAAAGGGGGGGGYAASLIPVSSLDAPCSVDVGGGGTPVAGAAGNDGGDSAFSDSASFLFVLGPGGNGGEFCGANAPPTRGGNGGAGGDVGLTGTVAIAGGAGSIAQLITTVLFYSGKGGDAARGGGGALAAVASGGGGTPPNVGGGGSGAAAGINQAAHPGGFGAPGLVVITEFYD